MAGRTGTNLGLKLNIINIRYHGLPQLSPHLPCFPRHTTPHHTTHNNQTGTRLLKTEDNLLDWSPPVRTPVNKRKYLDFLGGDKVAGLGWTGAARGEAN